jgi:microcin C transport system permease protein
MKWLDKRLNPNTRKRLARFREIKRAHWSFRILIVLYALSLCSELLCNDNPLYLRFNAKSYFPVFKYYPDDLFTGNGKKTRPDYKKIKRSQFFNNNPANFMIFAPVPFSPFEIINPESIEGEKKITVTFVPQLPIGTVDIRSDLTIAKGAMSGYFFDTQDKNVKSLLLSKYWSLTDEFSAAIERRFENRHADAISITAASLRHSGKKARISLSTFNPRNKSPKSVRITFRSSEHSGVKSETVIFGESREILKNDSSIWSRLSDSQRNEVLNLVGTRSGEPVDALTITVNDSRYETRFSKKDVHWPYPPVKGHWMGVDNAGRDVMARIVYGLRISMTFGLLLVFFSMTLGILIGAIQGYYGGKIDLITQRLIEIWSALPFLYIMILMGAIYGRSFVLLLLLYGIFNWIGISYYMRAEFLKLRKQSFVEAARSLGIPAYKIIFRHILPNALIPIVTFVPFSLVGAIGALAALDYLGFGLPPPTPSWGELLSQAQQFRWAWWLILYPALSLFIVMLLGVFVGEGVRNAFDPRRYSKIE